MAASRSSPCPLPAYCLHQPTALANTLSSSHLLSSSNTLRGLRPGLPFPAAYIDRMSKGSRGSSSQQIARGAPTTGSFGIFMQVSPRSLSLRGRHRARTARSNQIPSRPVRPLCCWPDFRHDLERGTITCSGWRNGPRRNDADGWVSALGRARPKCGEDVWC